MHINTQHGTPAVQELLTGAVRDTLAGWSRLIDAEAVRSKEIDALSVADASRYVEQRRQFEPQTVSVLTAFGCR